MNFTNKCLICNKDKDWKSDIWIVAQNLETAVTVCPDCRRKPIELLYGMIMTRIWEEQP